MADHSFGRLSQLARKTVDYHVSVINYLENRKFFKHESECPSIQPDPLYHSVMGVPISMNQQPSSAVTTVLMKTVTNKVKGPITCMAWNPDGKRLITGSHTGEVGLWSGLNFLHEAGMQGHDCPIRSMNFTHNENWFVTSDDRGWIKYWQTNMNVIHSFQAHQEPVRCVCFSPTDGKLATGSDDGSVKLWDFYKSVEEMSLRGHGGEVRGVSWHPSKCLLVTASKDSTQPIKLWDPKSGTSISTIHIHKGGVLDVKWNQNGNWFATASRDTLVKVFDIRNMKELHLFRAHKNDVNVVAWHPVHASILVSAGHEGSIFFWKMSVSREIGGIEDAHDSFITSLAWHPLGHLLASGSNDRTSKFWNRSKPGDLTKDKYKITENELTGDEPYRSVSLGSKYKSSGIKSGGAPGSKQGLDDLQRAANPPSVGTAVDVPVLGQDLVMTEQEIFSMTSSLSASHGGKPPPDSRDFPMHLRPHDTYSHPPPPPPPRGGRGAMNDMSQSHPPAKSHDNISRHWPGSHRPLSPPPRHELDPRGSQFQYRAHHPDDRRMPPHHGPPGIEGSPPAWPPPTGRGHGWPDRPIGGDPQFGHPQPPPPPPPPRSEGSSLHDPRSMRTSSGTQLNRTGEPKPLMDPRPLLEPQRAGEHNRVSDSSHQPGVGAHMPYHQHGPPPPRSQARGGPPMRDGSSDPWPYPPHGRYGSDPVPPPGRDPIREKPSRGYNDYPPHKEDPRRGDPRQRRTAGDGIAPPMHRTTGGGVAPPTHRTPGGGVAPPTHRTPGGGVAPPTHRTPGGGVAPPTHRTPGGGVVPPTHRTTGGGVAPPTHRTAGSGVAPPTYRTAGGGVAPPTNRHAEDITRDPRAKRTKTS